MEERVTFVAPVRDSHRTPWERGSLRTGCGIAVTIGFSPVHSRGKLCKVEAPTHNIICVDLGLKSVAHRGVGRGRDTCFTEPGACRFAVGLRFKGQETHPPLLSITDP